MHPLIRRTAGLVATAAALAALPGTAHATPPQANATSPYIGTFYTVSYGIPKTLRLGTTITVGNWFMQNSKDTLLYGGWDTLVMPPRGIHVSGVQVHYFWAGQWQAATDPYSQGSFSYDPPNITTDFRLAPHVKVRKVVDITFTKKAVTGHWKLCPEGTDGVLGMLKPNGQNDFNASLAGAPTCYDVNVTR